MVATQYLHEKVANALVELARLGPFYKRSFDKDTGAVTIDLADQVDPASIFAAEVSKNFEVDRNYGRSLKRQWSNWQFELRLKFDVPVSLEAFEANLCDAVPFIPFDSSTGLRQVTLGLIGGPVEHPPQQQPSSGTRVRYLFDAALAPQ